MTMTMMMKKVGLQCRQSRNKLTARQTEWPLSNSHTLCLRIYYHHHVNDILVL
jgi:hypothetical protein